MRVTLEVDGSSTHAEVDLARGEVRIGDRTFPVKVLASTPQRVEVEIAGERVVIEGWPEGAPTPIDPIAVDGERYRVRATVEDKIPTGAPTVVRTPPSASAPPAAPPSGGEGHAISPPMPGKVVEVRVAEGEHVRAGQVLLVLEAMKMRNEVTAPTAGTVRGLSVSAGSNVRARETMLRIEPG